MSRTDKDRPYWVALNDADVTSYEEVHQHHLFGKPIWGWDWEKDENGNVLWFSYLVTVRWGYRLYVLDDGSTATYQTLYAKNPKQWWAHTVGVIDVPPVQEVRWRKRRAHQVIRHFSDECTIDVPENPHQPTGPCYRKTPWYQNRRKFLPNREQRRFYHSSERRTETNTLRSLAKAYNGGADLDYTEKLMVRTETRLKRHLDWGES